MPQDDDLDDNEYEDQQDDEDNESTGIPSEVRKLRTQAYDKSLSDLHSSIESGDIVLDPDYQRNYVWDNKRASLLIESFLLNVPIPVIYVAEDAEGRWVVVDGLQRLNAIHKFFNNEIKLRGLEVFPELNRLQFSTLNPKAQRILRNGILRVIVIKDDSHPEIKYDIFQRLNRGSIKLNEQELRNCIYRGPLCELLKELRENAIFLKLVGASEPHKRYNDSELILRFFSFESAYDEEAKRVIGYPNKMKFFLNTFMDKNQNLMGSELDILRQKFEGTIEKVYAILPCPAFRRYRPEDDQPDTRLNRALMDAVMVAFSRVDRNALMSHKEAIDELYRSLPKKDSTFNDSLIYGTSDTKRIEYRINTFLKNIRETIG